MKNSKSTKRALFSSVLALVLCFAMLLGTTFAWFTDTAKTGVNKIQAGTLDIQLLDEDGNSLENKTLDFVKAEGHENEDILWEPGCTYNLQPITIKNNGNLAFKYKVIITGIGGNAKLNEVIDWTIGEAAIGTEQHLEAGGSSEFTISGHMQESAGNEYQKLTINRISITVYATQDAVEYDSNDNQYDKDATYYINESGTPYGTIYNATKVTLDSYAVEHEYDGTESDGMAFYLYNGAELTLNDVDFSTSVKNDSGKRNLGFFVYNGSKITINSGNFTMDGKYNALIWGQSSSARNTVTINGGTFTVKNGVNSSIISAYSNTDVYITGGFFDQSTSNPNVTLQWTNDCTMRVTGGTFVNYNPADHGAVPEGYTTVALPQSDGKVWYKVVPDNAKIVASVDELNAAMTAGKSIVLTDDITADAKATTAAGYGQNAVAAVNVYGTVLDGEGNTLTVTNANGTWDSGIMTNGGTIKNVTLKGSFRGIFTGGLSADLNVENVVLDDVTYTFSADGSGNYDVAFTNCTLNGWTSYTGGFKSVSFTGCKFGESRGYSYCRPYSDTTFTNCTFEAGYEFDATEATSKFVNCYVGATLITADNAVTLLGEDAANIVISNS